MALGTAAAQKAKAPPPRSRPTDLIPDFRPCLGWKAPPESATGHRVEAGKCHLRPVEGGADRPHRALLDAKEMNWPRPPRKPAQRPPNPPHTNHAHPTESASSTPSPHPTPAKQPRGRDVRQLSRLGRGLLRSSRSMQPDAATLAPTTKEPRPSSPRPPRER